jgi:Uri superfamily endonuclease
MAMETLDLLPVSSGAYALRIGLRVPVQAVIGRLGTFSFPTGDYLYLGSAQGNGGVRARMIHHLASLAAPRWHLDWLRPYSSATGCWWASPGESTLQCLWSQAIAALPGATIPAKGFGASDCQSSCPAHLVRLPDGASPTFLSAILQRVSPQPVRYVDLYPLGA